MSTVPQQEQPHQPGERVPQQGDMAHHYPPFIDMVQRLTYEGTVVAFDEAPTRFAKSCVIVTLRDKDGIEGSLWLTSTVLRSQFARLRPSLGERISVVYHGMRKGGDSMYHDFDVEAPDRDPFVPDWDAIEDVEPPEDNEG
jgi:hypothetical protein